MITVACVRTGTKYSIGYVLKLAAMCARHLSQTHRFVCLTDRPGDFSGIETVDVSPTGLRGWWAKMALFDFTARSSDRVLYLDLDMVVCGSLDPLAALNVEFGVCANFTRAAGNLNLTLQLLEFGGQSPDHPVHPGIPETKYLKTLFCRVTR